MVLAETDKRFYQSVGITKYLLRNWTHFPCGWTFGRNRPLSKKTLVVDRRLHGRGTYHIDLCWVPKVDRYLLVELRSAYFGPVMIFIYRGPYNNQVMRFEGPP